MAESKQKNKNALVGKCTYRRYHMTELDELKIEYNNAMQLLDKQDKIIKHLENAIIQQGKKVAEKDNEIKVCLETIKELNEYLRKKGMC